ncbi:MAG: FadR/GntR family transcriptional regulator [Haloechinothrix sp.]
MDAVLEGLRLAITQGEFPVGAKLPSEAVLAAEFVVSRSVIREALRALQALGMTTSHTGKGTYVVSVRPVESPAFGSYSARDLLEVRRHVEVPVTGYAAARRSAEDLHNLLSLVDQMDAEPDDSAWVALDTLFHISIARASRNPVFGKVIEEIRDALARQSTLLNQLGDRRARSNAEHRAIVAAIAGGDPDAAVAAMTTHLDHVDAALHQIVASAHASGATSSKRTEEKHHVDL